jgi:hypothetical protein
VPPENCWFYLSKDTLWYRGLRPSNHTNSANVNAIERGAGPEKKLHIDAIPGDGGRVRWDGDEPGSALAKALAISSPRSQFTTFMLEPASPVRDVKGTTLSIGTSAR